MTEELSAEVNDLTGVMIGMRGTAQEDGEAILFLAALGGIGGAPIFRRLFAHGFHHQLDGARKIAQDFLLGGSICFRKFTIAIADVTGPRDLGADVIVEISGEM